MRVFIILAARAQVEGVGDKTIPIPTLIQEYYDLTIYKTVTNAQCGSIVEGTITITNPNPADLEVVFEKQ
jgi:hypothetical protein